jgi:HAD superfamily hydrolase (TIGR01450 family)
METWVIDLDGVVWLAGEPLPGVDRAVAQLRHAGVRPLFVTNNSSPTHAELRARLQRCGIDAEDGDVVSSADAVATMLEPGARALVVADEGVLEALADRGVSVVDDGAVDAVVVGWTRRFDFDRMAAAASAVRRGARLLGTNEDATHPTPDGLLPGSGALLEAVAVAAGTRPEVAGKPHGAIVEVIGRRATDITWAVGDRPSTDGALARQLGARFALVLSGVTTATDDQGSPPPDLVAAGLSEAVGAISPP